MTTNTNENYEASLNKRFLHTLKDQELSSIKKSKHSTAQKPPLSSKKGQFEASPNKSMTIEDRILLVRDRRHSLERERQDRLKEKLQKKLMQIQMIYQQSQTIEEHTEALTTESNCGAPIGTTSSFTKNLSEKKLPNPKAKAPRHN